MTQEEKELLLRDLCARLPYGVKCYIKFDDGKIFNERTLAPVMIQDFKKHSFVSFIPYLRPMSSMTEEEYKAIRDCFVYCGDEFIASGKAVDYFNSHHFDYRDLIEKGLALQAPEGMYNIKEK